MIGQRANFTTGPDWLGIHKIPVKPSGLTPFEYTLLYVISVGGRTKESVE